MRIFVWPHATDCLKCQWAKNDKCLLCRSVYSRSVICLACWTALSVGVTRRPMCQGGRVSITASSKTRVLPRWYGSKLMSSILGHFAWSRARVYMNARNLSHAECADECLVNHRSCTYAKNQTNVGESIFSRHGYQSQ